MEEEKKKLFFGWTNIKKFISDIKNIYSSEKSFFSKKRIESGLAYIIGQFGMVFFLLKKYPSMTTSDIVMWASVEFLLSGYTVFQIQKEKKG